MKIIQIVTLITPQGAFGGPVRVAVNQVRALRAEGYDAVLVAGHMGFKGNAPVEFDGVPVKLFRAYKIVPKWGFSGIVSPAMIMWLFTGLRTADVIHIHMGRDFITLMSGLISLLMRKPYVVQTHGMVTPSERAISKPLDSLLTNKIFRGATKIFFLTTSELTGLRLVAGNNLPFENLINGVPSGSQERTAGYTNLDVLFLARLHPRKRPDYFAKVAAELTSEFPDATFTISGPDEGSKAEVMNVVDGLTREESRRISVGDAIPADQAISRIAACDIYVLPSIDEPFPMTVLEAMAAGVPVIVTDSCGLAPYIVAGDAGIVIGSSQEELSEAVRRLLKDEQLRSSLGANGVDLVEREFSMSRVISALTETYNKA